MKYFEMLKTRGMLLLFFILMFAPICVYAEETGEVDAITEGDSKGAAETEDTSKSTPDESETITDETAVFEGNYDNEEDANNRKEEKEKEYSDAGYTNIESEITQFTVEEETGKEIEEYVGSITETEEDAYVFDTEEEANAKKDELEVDNHDKKVTVTIKKRQKDSGKDEVTTITGQFNSVEEAEAYVAELKAQGYTVEYTVTQDSHEEEDPFEETYDRLAEANSTLDEYIETHTDASGNVEDILTEEVIDGPTTLDTPYETEAEAQAALQDYIAANEGDDYYYTGETTGPTPTGQYTPKEDINETFDNETEANEYVSQLEAQGYIVEYTFTNNTAEETESVEEKYGSQEAAEAALAALQEEYPEAEFSMEIIEAGTVYEAQTITEDMKIYQVGSTVFIIIKHGNEYFVWTEPHLTDEEIAQFKDTFADLHTSPPVTGSDIASNHTQFIDGYNVPYHTTNGKEFYFTLNEDNEISIVVDSGAESRVMYGSFEPVKQYVVKGTINKTVTLDSGTLTGTKKKAIEAYYNKVTKKAKKHKVTANGKKTVLDDTYTLGGTKSKDIMVDEYALDVTTETKQYETHKETVDTTWYHLVVKADIPQEKTKKQKKSKKETTNPQTGDSVITYIVTLTVSLGSLIGASRGVRRKEY